MANASSDNHLNNPPADDGQEPAEWDSVSIALPPDIKVRFFAAAKAKHLKPSQFGRLILVEALERHEAKAAAAV